MELISTTAAPAAIGPYSQAVLLGEMLHCSGQIGLRPDGSLVEGGVGEQARQALANLEAVCRAAGTDLTRTVRATIYLTGMDDFAIVNEVYERALDGHRPARATIAVAALPLSAAVEIDALVWCPKPE